MTSARILAALAMTAGLATWPSAVRADDLTWLGPARRIARGWSASRDTPAMNLVVVPRDVRTAGAELALATLQLEPLTLRLGFAGLLELESDGETESISNLFPHGQGALLWRGSYAYVAAVALDRAGARLCRGCDLEVTAQYRHESQHYTGSNAGDAGMDVRAEPYMGDDVLVDIAASVPSGRWLLVSRATAMAYLPGRSSYSAGAALDLHARWRRGGIEPFLSGYAERLLGTELLGHAFDDAYLLRALAGGAVTSPYGDILLYAFGDVGNRKGIRGLTEEATLGVGIRLVLGPPAR